MPRRGTPVQALVSRYCYMNRNRNIIRLDQQTTGAYLVRVTRKGVLHSKYFPDAEYGGKRKGLAAAREYRDELESALKGYTVQQLAKRGRSNNTSGIVGVRVVEEVDYRWESQPTYRYWVAQWSPKKGVRKTARFSVEKYGEEEAYRLAVKARKKGLESMQS